MIRKNERLEIVPSSCKKHVVFTIFLICSLHRNVLKMSLRSRIRTNGKRLRKELASFKAQLPSPASLWLRGLVREVTLQH
jgi:hypothetical protein